MSEAIGMTGGVDVGVGAEMKIVMIGVGTTSVMIGVEQEGGGQVGGRPQPKGTVLGLS